MNRAEPGPTVHRGKWSQPDVPHKGWRFRNFDDLGDLIGTCEMCETQPIRYVHYLEHSDYPRVLGVGSVCAENMEEDYTAAPEREKKARSLGDRRARWMEAEWRTSRKGNQFINRGGFNTVVYPRANGWTYTITDRESDRTWRGGGSASVDEAKLAAFDRFVLLMGLDW